MDISKSSLDTNLRSKTSAYSEVQGNKDIGLKD